MTAKIFWKAYKKEKKEHPNLSHNAIMQIVKDHFKPKRKMKIPTNASKWRRTSRDKGHTHKWKIINKYTTWDKGHYHPIDLKRMIAKKGKSDHTHKLLRR